MAGKKLSKHWRNLPISNPKSDLHNINAHTKFGKNRLVFAQVIGRKRKYRHVVVRYLCQKLTKFCPLASNPKARSPQYHCTYRVWWKSIKIYSSYWLEPKIRADNLVWNLRHLPINNPKPLAPIYMCTQNLNQICQEIFKLESGNQALTDGRTRTLGGESIIHCHCRVVGYKNGWKQMK